MKTMLIAKEQLMPVLIEQLKQEITKASGGKIQIKKVEWIAEGLKVWIQE